VVGNSLNIEEQLVRNELDIGLVGGHLAREGLLLDHVADDRIVCFCAPGHPLAKARRVSITALSREIWVTREKGSATRELFERRWQAAGGSPRRTIELSSPEGIKALVRAGIGVSFLSVYAIAEECARKRLRRLRVPSLELTRPIYLVAHPDKCSSPNVQAFREAIRQGLSEGAPV